MWLSLAIVVPCAWSGPYSDLDRQLGKAKTAEQVSRSIAALSSSDATLGGFVDQLNSKDLANRKLALESAKLYVSARASSEAYSDDSLAKKQSKEIKRSPLYRDERVQSSNWFARAAENLWKILKKWFNFKMPKPKAGNSNLAGILGTWLIWGVWALLFALVVAFGYFAIRQARWRSNLRRKAKAMLEEDEPERTLDEWLERANLLESEGKYREAVRCLYLACLLKFDEARIARFERGQTNWEHLHRIQQSPKLPLDIDFQPTTEAFDRIWYGMSTEGKPDVERFRRWYQEITEKVVLKAA